MNRRFFLAAVPAGLAATLTGCAAYVRHGQKEHVLTFPRAAAPGAVITLIKTSETSWTLIGLPPGTKVE